MSGFHTKLPLDDPITIVSTHYKLSAFKKIRLDYLHAGLITASLSSRRNFKTTFPFPKESQAQKAWLTAINRKDYVVTKNYGVFARHLDESEIQRIEKYKKC